MRRNVMNDRRWMDGWPLVYDAVTQEEEEEGKKEAYKRKGEENVSLPLSLFLSFALFDCQKRKAKVILSTWNKSTWFLLAFSFYFYFTIHYLNIRKRERECLFFVLKRISSSFLFDPVHLTFFSFSTCRISFFVYVNQARDLILISPLDFHRRCGSNVVYCHIHFNSINSKYVSIGNNSSSLG